VIEAGEGANTLKDVTASAERLRTGSGAKA